MIENIKENILNVILYNTYYDENNIEKKSRTEKFKLEKPFVLPKSTTEEDIVKISNTYYGSTNQTQARMRRLSRIMKEKFPEEYEE